MLRDYPQDFYTSDSLSKPCIFIGNGVAKRPLRLCSECAEPLPERRVWNQVAHAGPCQDARDKQTQKRALERRRRKHKTSVVPNRET
jgi:hypothetical protein